MIPKIILSFSLLLSPLFATSTLQAETAAKENVTVVNETDTTQEPDKEEQKPLLELSKTEFTIEKDASIQLIYTLQEGATLSFKAQNPEILAIDNQGRMQGLKAGTTAVAVTATKDEINEQYELKVTVYELSGKITFDYNEFNLSRGYTYEVPYKIEGNMSDNELIWESDNPSIASVEDGKVTGHKIGTTTIRVFGLNTQDETIVHVIAPLKDMVFNPEKVSMTVGEKITMPDLVFVPYDTTTPKEIRYEISDRSLLEIEEDQLHALKPGKVMVHGFIGEVEAQLEVIIEPKLTESGSNIVDLKIEHLENNQMILFHDDLSQYKAQTFALKLPTREIIEYLNEHKTLDLIIVLNDRLYEAGMKNVESFVINESIMNILDGKQLNIHLLNQANKPQLIYSLNGAQKQALDLRFNISKLDNLTLNKFNIKGHAYHLQFKNHRGFPLNTVVKIPAERINAHFNQLHFIYTLQHDELVDTQQSMSIDSQDYLEFEISESDYIVTIAKVSTKSDSKVIMTLSIILILLLITFVLVYLKKHKKI